MILMLPRELESQLAAHVYKNPASNGGSLSAPHKLSVGVSGQSPFYSVHTRRFVKKRGFARGFCKNR